MMHYISITCNRQYYDIIHIGVLYIITNLQLIVVSISQRYYDPGDGMSSIVIAYYGNGNQCVTGILSSGKWI
jgi:hypothetical protein